MMDGNCAIKALPLLQLNVTRQASVTQTTGSSTVVRHTHHRSMAVAWIGARLQDSGLVTT